MIVTHGHLVVVLAILGVAYIADIAAREIEKNRRQEASE
jgi:hypothetical protein